MGLSSPVAGARGSLGLADPLPPHADPYAAEENLTSLGELQTSGFQLPLTDHPVFKKPRAKPEPSLGPFLLWGHILCLQHLLHSCVRLAQAVCFLVPICGLDPPLGGGLALEQGLCGGRLVPLGGKFTICGGKDNRPG